MTQLKPSEKRMLLILAVGIFLIANILGWTWYSGLMLRSQRKLGLLRAKASNFEMWKREANSAAGKREWIGTNLKEYPDEAFRDTYLDALVQGELRSGLDLELLSPRPLDTQMPSDELPFVRSRYEAKVKGTWADVMTFVYRLQKPAEFRFVPRLTMVPRKNEENDAEQLVECTLMIEKWWSPDSGAAQEMTVNEASGEQISAPPVQASSSGAVPSVPAETVPAAQPVATPIPASNGQ
jgi:hypothetical protein